jgi:hypothetical protein
MATRGDVFDKVLYEANLKWIVPSIIGSVGLLLSGAVGAIGFWFWLREGNLPQGFRKS